MGPGRRPSRARCSSRAIGCGSSAGPAPSDLGGAEVVDARGLAVAPGIVDLHTHSDVSNLSEPHAISAIEQGVTTQVVGLCGFSAGPVRPDTFATMIEDEPVFGFPDVPWDWTSIGGYRGVGRSDRRRHQHRDSARSQHVAARGDGQRWPRADARRAAAHAGRDAPRVRRRCARFLDRADLRAGAVRHDRRTGRADARRRGAWRAVPHPPARLGDAGLEAGARGARDGRALRASNSRSPTSTRHLPTRRTRPR